MKIQDEEALRSLVERLLDPKRVTPIVALSSRAGEREPAISPEEARQAIGDGPEIVSLPTGPLTFLLAELLSNELGVFGGAARIWWPGLTVESHPLDHPLIYERHGVYGTKAIKRLGDSYVQRDYADPPRAGADARVDLLKEQLSRSEAAIAELREALADRTARMSKLQEALESARQRARDLSAVKSAESNGTPNGRLPGGSAEDLFLRQLFEAWIADTTTDDRRERPLSPFSLGKEFLGSIAGVEIPVERVARACSWIASRKGPDAGGLRPHAFREGRGGEDPQRRRKSDGALAWRAALKVGSPAAPRLHYWSRPDGVIEFASVNFHDDYSIPE